MNTYVQPGRVCNLVAPYAVASGAGAQIGNVFGVAQDAIASGVAGPFLMEGVVTLPTNTGETWTAGEPVYWDNTNYWLTSVATTGIKVGWTLAAKASALLFGTIKLNDIPSAVSGGKPAQITGLTDNTGGTSADPTIAAVTAPTALVDSTGGTPSTTFAAITAGASYAQADMVAAKNALSEVVTTQALNRAAIVSLTNAVSGLIAQLNTITTALHNAGVTT